MFDEFKKFINSVLAERTATPLFGTFAIAWSIWNWKILYLTFFVDGSAFADGVHKLVLVSSKINIIDSLMIPLLYTAFLLLIAPYAANWTYKKSLKFRRERIKTKEEILFKGRMMTPEQADQIKDAAQARVARAEKIAESNDLQRQLAEEERQKLQVALDQLKQTLPNRPDEVLRAVYGNDASGFLDVIVFIRPYFEKAFFEESILFEVKNETFSIPKQHPDPANGYWKNLEVVLVYDNNIYSFQALEGDSVIFKYADKDFSVEVIPGDQSKKMKEAIESSDLPYYSNIRAIKARVKKINP